MCQYKAEYKKDNVMERDKILILPLDGSQASLAALLPARSLSLLLDLAINIIFVSDDELSTEEIMKKLGLDYDYLPHFMITQKKGAASKVILEESLRASYIVMSTHGETKDLSKFTGSTACEIIVGSKIPVLLVRPDQVLDHMDNIWKPKKILIPLNGYPGAAQALKPLIELIIKTNSEVDLLHVAEISAEDTSKPGGLKVPYYEDSPHYEWPSWSQEFFRRFCQILRNHNHIEFALSLSKGDPAEEILGFASENNNDLIAMAWHGKLGHLRAATLRKVVSEASCPILLIKIIEEE